MPSFESEMNISITRGNREGVTSSSRYHWASDQRGDDHFVIIQYTISGHGTFLWQGRSWDVPPGHAFICIVPEQSAYYYPEEATETWRFAWLNFYGPLAITFCRALRDTYGPILPLPPPSSAAMNFLDLTAKGENRLFLDPSTATLAAFTFLVEWKRILERPQPGKDDPVEKVMRICQARFREPLGIKELAAQTNLSREHLTRIFTERTGISPARHLRQLRLCAAREILEHPYTTLKEAAFRCGFSSVKALQRALKSERSAE